MYDPKSKAAEDFINHDEIESTLAYAEEHKADRALIEALIHKASQSKGLTHREAAVLLRATSRTATRLFLTPRSR